MIDTGIKRIQSHAGLELGIRNRGCLSLVNPENSKVKHNIMLCLTFEFAKFSGCQTLLSKDFAGASSECMGKTFQAATTNT